MDWQPIETAPKDGTPILLVRWGNDFSDADLGPDAGVIAHWAHWPDHQGWYVSGFGVSDQGHRHHGAGELDDNGFPDDLGPTHWCALGSAPQPKGGA